MQFLFRLLYQISLSLYKAAAHITALWNSKAKKWTQAQKKVWQLLEQYDLSNEKIIWIHCASLGEFEQARPIIDGIKKTLPNFKILTTFFSPSGYEVRKNYPNCDYTTYLPLDSSNNAKRFIEHVQPQAAIFVKYELWYHYLTQLKLNNIPVLLVSARFRKGQIYFGAGKTFWKNTFDAITHFFVQDEVSKELLKKTGYSNITIAGDTRFDRVMAGVAQKSSLEKIEHFKGNSKLIIGGSTWAKDEQLLLRALEKLDANHKLILAPHEIGKGHIKQLVQSCSFPIALYSDDLASIKEARVLIIKNIGLLSKIYAYADMAFIGGGFGKGIHNILEAAVYQIPVFFGPNYQKFKEAHDLIHLECAWSVNSANEFTQLYRALNSDKRNKIVQSLNQYFRENIGGTDKVLQYLHAELNATQ